MNEEQEEINSENNIKPKTGNEKENFWSRNWSWLIAMTVTAVFLLLMMFVLKVLPSGERSLNLIDSIHQYVPFFSDYQDKLKNGGNLYYTWDVGLGQNFQSLLLYYMASPINLILVFFERKSIPAVMSFIIVLKMVISSGTFSFFLSRRRERPENNLLISMLGIAYALNNYMCGYFWNIMWLDCIMVFPLIIMGFERLMERRDPRLYLAALFYSMYCNYYISFIICIFLVLWFLVSEHKNFKKFIKDGLIFSGCSILSAGMAAVSLITAYLAIMKTSSAGKSIPEWKWYQSFWELLKSVLFMTKPLNMNVFDGNANLYCGTICCLMLFIYILSNKVKPLLKIRRLMLLAFLIISMNQELLNFIWHGFHNQFGIPNRFSFLYIFTLLVISYETLENIGETKFVSILAGAVLTAVFVGLLFYKVDIGDGKNEVIIFSLSLFLIFFYTILLLLRHVKLFPARLSIIFMAVVSILEIMMNAGVGLAENGAAHMTHYLKYCDLMDDAVSDIEKMSEQRNDVFYRQDIVKPVMLDENTFENMHSIGTFCTTVRGDVVEAMPYLGFYRGENEYLYDGATPLTNDLFGVKYVYVRDGDYFPAPEDMKVVLEKENLKVYENTGALPIAFGAYKNIYNYEPRTYNAAENLNMLAWMASGTGNIYKEVSPYFAVTGEGCVAEYNSNNSNIISYGNGEGDTISITATFAVEEPGRYFINCRANNIDKITYYKNGSEMTSGRYQAQMMDLGYLDEGDNAQLVIDFTSGYSETGSITMYTSILNKDQLTQFRAEMIKNSMLVSEAEDGYIKGKISLTEGKTLLTTVPYDEGWSVYVDGEKADIKIWADAFISVEVPEGSHEVEFRFRPEGMDLGILISTICWIVYIILFIYMVKKPKK